jgi:hypothetical protein
MIQLTGGGGIVDGSWRGGEQVGGDLDGRVAGA